MALSMRVLFLLLFFNVSAFADGVLCLPKNTDKPLKQFCSVPEEKALEKNTYRCHFDLIYKESETDFTHELSFSLSVLRESGYTFEEISNYLEHAARDFETCGIKLAAFEMSEMKDPSARNACFNVVPSKPEMDMQSEKFNTDFEEGFEPSMQKVMEASSKGEPAVYFVKELDSGLNGIGGATFSERKKYTGPLKNTVWISRTGEELVRQRTGAASVSYHTLAHELGHALGLPHAGFLSNAPRRIMAKGNVSVKSELRFNQRECKKMLESSFLKKLP